MMKTPFSTDEVVVAFDTELFGEFLPREERVRRLILMNLEFGINLKDEKMETPAHL